MCIRDRRRRAPVELCGALVATRTRGVDGSANGASLRLVPAEVAAAELGLRPHRVAFSARIPLPAEPRGAEAALHAPSAIGALHAHLERVLPAQGLRLDAHAIAHGSLRVAREADALALSWALEDDPLAERVIACCEDWAELQAMGT